VGTERTKSRILLSPPIVNNVEYGLLRDLNFKSTVKKAQEQRVSNVTMQDNQDPSEIMNTMINTAKYIHICKTFNTIISSRCSDCIHEMIGFKILEHRSGSKCF
jgi:hypothetical protein